MFCVNINSYYRRGEESEMKTAGSEGRFRITLPNSSLRHYQLEVRTGSLKPRHLICGKGMMIPALKSHYENKSEYVDGS